MADLQQTLNEAHCTVLDAAPGVQALTGRSSDNILPWQDVAPADLPVLLYQPIGLTLVAGGLPQTWEAQFQLDAVATGNGASRKVNDLIAAALTALTHTALKAAGVDAILLREVRQSWPPVATAAQSKSSSRLTARATVTITYRVFA